MIKLLSILLIISIQSFGQKDTNSLFSRGMSIAGTNLFRGYVSQKQFVIDWDKVETFEDYKKVMKSLGEMYIQFSWPDTVPTKYKGIYKYLKPR